jgi:muconate cycloisomerase
MRITSVTLHRVRIPFKSAVSHALCRRRETQTVVVVLESDAGHIGIGEILPREYLTGETLERVLSVEAPALVRRWLGRPFDTREQVVTALCADLENAGSALATFAGWEMAVLDLAGRTFGFTVGGLLGREQGSNLEEGAVIDFSVPTQFLEKHCFLLRVAGYHHLKVKVGLPDDLRRIEIVRQVFGLDIPLRVDANGAWTEDSAISVLRQMRQFNIRSVEQPVQAFDLRGMRKVRESTGIAVVADESLCSLTDAQSLIAERAADYFNIRIAKCGGFLACLRLANLASEAGLRCDLGCLVGESGILSRAAEIFSRHIEGLEFIEGKHQNKHLLVEDIIDSAFEKSAVDINGLGIRLSLGSLERWTVSAPKIFKAPQGAQA